MTEQTNLVPKRRFKEFHNTHTWEQHKFSELVSRVSTSSEEEGLPRVEFEDIISGLGKLNKDIFQKESDKKGVKFKTGDILFGKLRPYLKNWLMPDFKGIAVGDFWVFRPNDTDNKFIYSLIQSNKYQTVANLSTGTKMPRSDWGIVSNTEFTVPFSVEEQTKIGNFFAQLDYLITLQQRKLEKTNALKSAYLSEMFPAEGEREPKRRFAGFTDDWEQRTIGEFGSFYYGKSAPKWSVTSDSTTPCVRYGELYTKHKEKIDTIYSFTNIPKENLKFSTGKEVLVPRVGEDPLDFANCSWLSIPEVAIGEMISVYNTKQNPLFTAYMFNALFKYEFAKRVEGGNVSNLYYAYLENIPVSYPSLEEQDKIASFFDNLSTLIAVQQRKLEKLQNIKKAYLNEMFV
ncbi:restriction endonuclease subunit S [Bacillus sp. C-3-6]